jgi:hypothetical protein
MTSQVEDLGTSLTVNTIRLSLAWYFVAVLVMMRLTSRDWIGATKRGQLARWCWTWGVICFVVHVAMAFHFYHHWSHAHAFAHTREISGVGEGVYISYLFTILWVTDAIWWWCWPDRYASRPKSWTRFLHTFMLFIIFNGTIVFESGTIRWVSIAAFMALPITWIYSRRPQLREETC